MRHFAFITVATLVFSLWPWPLSAPWACQPSFLLTQISHQDVLLLAGPDGRILCKKNETKKYAPASTMKIVTALAALHHMGEGYRFKTDFYLDRENNMTVKGYGDPLLVSEELQGIAQILAPMVHECMDLVLDHSYFVPHISIPGVDNTTNPYDAPVGALCANFNTVLLEQDKGGRMISGEPQTPITPLILKDVRLQESGRGRHTFTHDSGKAALYAGELLVHFLRESGEDCLGKIGTGVVGPEDELFYTYRSSFTLEQALQRMLEFSNNFMANQILIALGAHVHGPPGTLEKGVQVVSRYSKEVLGFNDPRIVEGSGISRKNLLSAMDMLAVLKTFEPHRCLLKRQGGARYKSGSLKGLRTRAGYIEYGEGRSYYFVISLESPYPDMDWLTNQLQESLHVSPND